MSCCFCFAFRRGLRPGCGLANRASKPPFSTARRHRFTEETEAPTSSATSSTSLPSCNNRSANSRRACSSAALPFGLISYHTHDPCGWFIDYVGVNNAYLLRKTWVGCVLARTNMDLPRNQVRASAHPTVLEPSATETNASIGAFSRERSLNRGRAIAC